MKRALASLVVIVAIVSTALLGGASAQGNASASPEATIAAYQTQVAELNGKVDTQATSIAKRDTKIDTQRTQIAGYKATVATLETQVPPTAPAGTPLTGIGTTVSDKFTLQAGRYKVTATIEVAQVDGFILVLYGPNPSDRGTHVLNEITDQPGTWTISAIFTAPQSGAYFAEVSNVRDSWTVTFTPI